VAQVAFVRRRSAIRRDDNLHYPKGAGHHARFTADTFFSIHQHAVILLANRAIGAAARAGRAFTVATRYRVTLALVFNNGNARQKALWSQDMLFSIMRHHAGHFATFASNAFATIAHNKVVHTSIRLIGNNPSFSMIVYYPTSRPLNNGHLPRNRLFSPESGLDQKF
jgi:hypothetical protein